MATTKKKPIKKGKNLPKRKIGTTKKVTKADVTKDQISAKMVGVNVIANIDGKKYARKVTDVALALRIKKDIDTYNKRNSKLKKEAILAFFKEAENKKSAELKGKKKSIKKKLKTVKNELAVKKKVVRSTINKLDKEYGKYLVVTPTGGLAMKGLEQVEMPELLVKRINDFINAKQNIKTLLNFWSLCLLNPNPVARMKLFDYIEHQNLTLTPSGYLVTFRMVKKTEEEGVYTDAHTGTMKYLPGTICSIPREECDEDGGNDCSKGLHTGTPKFIGIIAQKKVNYEEGATLGEGYGTGVKTVTTKSATPDSYGTGYDCPTPTATTAQFDNSFGNQAIMCYVNPAHVVSVPNYDSRKMRSCEFYFAKLTTPEEVIDMVEKDYLLYDDDYNKLELEQLQQMLKGKEIKSWVNATSKEANTKKVKTLEAELADIVKQGNLRLGSDKINPEITMDNLKQIIKQRQVLLKGK